MKTSQKKKHPSILETVHETAQGLYDAHIINATTMREFDELCLRARLAETLKSLKK